MGKMNPDIKAKWLEALRDPDRYKQTEGALKDNCGFCCLGVLTDIWARENDGKWVKSTYGGPCSILDTDDVLPEKVRDWAGLEYCDPIIDSECISHLNDHGFKFSYIADLIEEQL